MQKDAPLLLSDPSLYINRELSWLEFNQRVLEEAQDQSNPLLERLKFLCIVASNLDEFFEIRVAGLKQQRESSVSEPGLDGMSPGEQLAAISARVRKMVDDKYLIWSKELVPALEQKNIFFLSYNELTKEEKQYYTKHFEKSVYPVLTPLAVDPFHPFPHLLNKSLNVAVELEGTDFLRLMPVISEVDRPDLKFRPFVPAVVSAAAHHEDIFSQIRHRQILLHHPYESFQTVLDFIEQAAEDPNVLAIKHTLYRTSGDSQIVASLAEAAQTGKQVTVVIELKARFDEAANINWARTLQEAGAHVVYGIVGLKTHAKLALVVRREEDGIRRYLHLGTGNYNQSTAKLYEDFGLLTCDPDITNDSAELFNWLTGVSVFPQLKKIKAAPKALHAFVLEMIEREIDHAKSGKPAAIFGKVNALVDEEVIAALYMASQAGVKVKLLVRGVCCLRSKVPGVSDNVTVRSVIGRFLEHSRIYRFENAGNPEVYLASADWMARNFFRRVETCFPVEDAALRAQIDQILDIYWKDNVKAREQGPEPTVRRALEGE